MIDILINISCGFGIFFTGITLGAWFTTRAIQKIFEKEMSDFLDKNDIYAVKKEKDS